MHGDLHVRHILVDAAGSPCGIIDWGDVHVGTIAIDLALAFTFFPGPGRDEFMAAYGAVEPAIWRLARLRALHHTIALLAFGQATDDTAIVREGLYSLTSTLGS